MRDADRAFVLNNGEMTLASGTVHPSPSIYYFCHKESGMDKWTLGGKQIYKWTPTKKEGGHSEIGMGSPMKAILTRSASSMRPAGRRLQMKFFEGDEVSISPVKRRRSSIREEPRDTVSEKEVETEVQVREYGPEGSTPFQNESDDVAGNDLAQEAARERKKKAATARPRKKKSDGNFVTINLKKKNYTHGSKAGGRKRRNRL